MPASWPGRTRRAALRRAARTVVSGRSPAGGSGSWCRRTSPARAVENPACREPSRSRSRAGGFGLERRKSRRHRAEHQRVVEDVIVEGERVARHLVSPVAASSCRCRLADVAPMASSSSTEPPVPVAFEGALEFAPWRRCADTPGSNGHRMVDLLTRGRGQWTCARTYTRLRRSSPGCPRTRRSPSRPSCRTARPRPCAAAAAAESTAAL